MASKIQIRRGRVDYITIKGILIPKSNDDYLKLALLCERFKKAVEVGIRLQINKVKKSDGIKVLSREFINNWWYSQSAWDYAKLLFKGAKANNGNPKHIHLKSKFVISYPKSNEGGNRNIKLSENSVKIRFGKEWLLFECKFPNKFRELVKEVQNYKYGAVITMRDGRIYINLQVPFEIYLKYFGRENSGKLFAGFDLNSDRINMVIVDEFGSIREVKNIHFHEVVSPGFSKNKAKDLRLKALSKLLDYAYYHNVGVVFFEDLDLIKRNKKNGKLKSKKGNRKANLFAKKQLLNYGITMALKRGFRVYLVNPAYTSKNAKKIKDKLGLDVHTTSAYVICCKGLKLINNHDCSRILTKN